MAGRVHPALGMAAGQAVSRARRWPWHPILFFLAWMIVMPLDPAARADETAPDLDPRFLQPQGWEWGSFTNAEGARIRYGHARPSGEVRGTVVLLTGFNEFAEKYFETARDLLARGFAVWEMDWRGQGGSDRYYANPQKIGSVGLRADAADLHQFVTEIVEPAAAGPLIAVTHSSGGQIILPLLRDHPEMFAAAVLSAPMLEIETGSVPPWLARLLARVATGAGFGHLYIPGAGDWSSESGGNYRGRKTSHDAVRVGLRHQWLAARPDLRTGGATFAWLDAAFRSVAETQSETYLRAIRTPVLIGSPKQDDYVEPAAHRRACKILPACEIIDFPEARHELFMETDRIRDRWFDAIDAFLARHLKAAP